MALTGMGNLEIELKKRHRYPYQWFRKQNDQWDQYTNFIYSTPQWQTLIEKIKEVHRQHQLDKNEIFQYAANRWYNFHSAKAIETIFLEIGDAIPAEDKDSEKDFYLNGIAFDHKTSVFPREYPVPFQEAKENKGHLIEWLYNNQSREKRFHLKNRLFVVVYDQRGEHWKLKAELALIKNAIHNYLTLFDPHLLHCINFGDQQSLSDIIWVER